MHCGLTTAVADRLIGLVQKEALLARPGEVTNLYGASSVGNAGSSKLCMIDYCHLQVSYPALHASVTCHACWHIVQQAAAEFHL